jgi:hypothetical protein
MAKQTPHTLMSAHTSEPEERGLVRARAADLFQLTPRTAALLFPTHLNGWYTDPRTVHGKYPTLTLPMPALPVMGDVARTLVDLRV